MNNIIELKNVSYRYEDQDNNKLAVRNVNFNIKQGSFITILGHNGSGKSTLAKMLNAIFIPTEGTVIIDNYISSDKENLFEIRQVAGMVFQNPDNQIVATMVEDDVAFGPENLGVEPKEIRRRVDKALEIVRMKEFAMKSPHMLSGGQKQRVAIAGIIAMKPKCIIFDESTAMLDPRGRKEVMDTAKQLNKDENITIINITHFMQEAVDSDYIFVLEEGELIMQGTPKEIFPKVDELQKLNLDVPPMTYLAYLLKKEGIPIDQDILNIDEMVEALCRLK